MMERWKNLSRGRKIALDFAVVLLLLLVLWLVWVPSAELAFRRAVAGVGYDGRDPELLMDLEYDKVESGQLNTQKRRIGLLTDGELVLRVELYQELGWKSWDPVLVPASDGVLYTPLPKGFNFHSGYGVREFIHEASRGVDGEEGPCDLRIPAFAVKARGADATLTLTLEDCEDGNGNRTDQAGPFPLVLQEKQDGWFIFRWDSLDMIGHYHDKGSGWFERPYNYLSEWIETYNIQKESRSARATLELTTRDEAGNVLEQVAWALP